MYFIENIFIQRLIRRNLVIFACDQGFNECVAKAKEYFVKWMNTEDTNEFGNFFIFNLIM